MLVYNIRYINDKLKINNKYTGSDSETRGCDFKT